MEDLVRQAIAITEQKRKRTVPWQLDEPYRQPYHRWDHDKWTAVQPGSHYRPTTSSDFPASIALYSWNIDFMLPFPDSRMHAAIRHLESLVREQVPSQATIIYFNECLESDIKLIASDKWVRSTFSVTDMDGEYWQSGHYGTTTLVDRRLPIRDCFRVHYAKSRMERDGLFVDVSAGRDSLVRFCNTHLESLALVPPFRPVQMALCATYMHSGHLAGAVIAGDFNAIEEPDETLHSENGLKDAYLDLGGSETNVSGHTWGQQAATAQRSRFGTSRMDKVFFCGQVKCISFSPFGAGIEVEEQSERKEIVRLGFDAPWITDHLGIKAVLAVSSG